MAPLVRSPRVRRLAAVGLVLGAVLAWFTLSMLFAPLVFAGTMAFALAAPRAGRTIAAGRWNPGVVEVVAIAVVVAVPVLLGVTFAWDALETWRTRTALGTSTRDVTRALAPVVLAMLVLAVLAATLPLPAPRRVSRPPTTTASPRRASGSRPRSSAAAPSPAPHVTRSAPRSASRPTSVPAGGPGRWA